MSENPNQRAQEFDQKMQHSDPNNNLEQHDGVVTVEAALINGGKKIRFSNSSASTSYAESWNMQHFGHALNRGKMKWKYPAFLLVFVFVLSLVLWECVSFFELKRDWRNTKREIQMLTYKLEHSKVEQEESLPKPLKRSSELQNSKAVVAAIGRCGDGGAGGLQTETTKAAEAISFWETKMQKGDIRYSGAFIIIERPGIYYLYAQLNFNGEKTANGVPFNFYILKNRHKRLAITTVPRASCKPSCTQFVAAVVKLDKGDDLSVATSESDIKLMMSCEKAFFGANLLTPL